MERYLISMSLLLLLLASCGGNKTKIVDEEVAPDTLNTDTTAVDSMEIVMESMPVPKAADELFDDFIFNFAANKKLQMERILFPLQSYKGKEKKMISKSEWKMDYFFMRQGYYTVLFDDEQAMNVVKDTHISHAVLEKIYFNTSSVIQYVFDRPKGAWILTALRTIPISQSTNASFLQFYHRFATDKEFQTESLGETVKFVGPDPDDDFSQMEGIITRDTWEAFAPELPTRIIYNIIYGQPKKEAQTKLFVMRGIANGLEMEMSFKNKGGKWILVKLTT